MLHSVYSNPESKPKSRSVHVSLTQAPYFKHLMPSCSMWNRFCRRASLLARGWEGLPVAFLSPMGLDQITGPQDPREPQFESQITLEKRLSNTFVIFIYRLILQASWQTPLFSSLSRDEVEFGLTLPSVYIPELMLQSKSPTNLKLFSYSWLVHFSLS